MGRLVATARVLADQTLGLVFRVVTRLPVRLDHFRVRLHCVLPPFGRVGELFAARPTNRRLATRVGALVRQQQGVADKGLEKCGSAVVAV